MTWARRLTRNRQPATTNNDSRRSHQLTARSPELTAKEAPRRLDAGTATNQQRRPDTMSKMRMLPLAVFAVAIAGALALMAGRDANAALQPNPEDGFTLNVPVVLSGGVVRATLVGQDDEAPNGDNLQIFAPSGNVDNTGEAPGGDIPAGIDPVSCTIAGGAACDEAIGDPNVGPVGCNPTRVGFACIQYGDANLDDEDTTQETVTIVVDITVTCTGPTLVPITGWQGDDSQDTDLVACYVAGTGNVQIEKIFPGDAATLFTYQLMTDGAGCLVVVGGGAPMLVVNLGTFTMTAGQLAEIFCGVGNHSVTELNTTPGAVFVSLVCDQVDQAGPTFSWTNTDDPFPGERALCIYTNAVSEDNPDVPNIVVTKVCFGTGFDATFDITIGDQTETVPCDGSTTLVDAVPGTYPVSEDISDPTGFDTLIFCGNDPVVVGTSTEVTIPDVDPVDVSCVILNNFDPEGDDDVEDLICSCTCCGLNLELDLDNTNTNTIGIENENENENTNNNTNDNENNNTNTNTQDQTNDQNQDNNNSQTNNITSSPEVNIDFDEKH
jgi:hypothetical protein